MINSPTVFILGAGASKPYGFPLGDELRVEIINSLGRNTSDRRTVCKHGGFQSEDVARFANSFVDSSLNSIDSFLSKRGEFERIGKYAISVLLGYKERIGQFRDPTIDDNWYSNLWNALISDVPSINKLSLNKIKIITFNYDRSLEHFLLTSIINTFGVPEEEAYQALNKLPILHVYGSLGQYVRTSYGIHTDELFAIAANNIKIIPEARDDDPSFQQAQEWLFSAKKICFLGFGFDELNTKRLNLKSVLKNKKLDAHGEPLIVASTFGMTDAEVSLAKSLLGVNTAYWHGFNGKSLDTIREHIHLLR